MVCTEAAGRESLALAELLLTCQVHHEHHSAGFWRVPGGLGLVPAHQTLAPGTSLSLSPSPSVPCTHLRRCLTPSWLRWEHQTSGLKWINSHPNHKPGKTAQSGGAQVCCSLGKKTPHPWCILSNAVLSKAQQGSARVSSLWKEGSGVRSSPRHVYPWFQHPWAAVTFSWPGAWGAPNRGCTRALRAESPEDVGKPLRGEVRFL